MWSDKARALSQVGTCEISRLPVWEDSLDGSLLKSHMPIQGSIQESCIVSGESYCVKRLKVSRNPCSAAANMIEGTVFEATPHKTL